MKGNGIVHILGVFGMLCWGLSFIWSNEVYASLNPTTTIFLRLVISCIVLYITLSITGKKQKIRREHLKLFALAAMFEPFLYFICEGYGLKGTSPIVCSAIIATIPLFGTLAACIFLKEKMTAWNVVGFLVSFLGVMMMLVGKNMELSGTTIGIAFLLAAVVVAVGYSLLLRKLALIYNPLTVTMTQNMIGMIYFIPLVVITEKGLLGSVFPPSTDVLAVKNYIVPLLLLGVFASSVAYLIWTLLFGRLGAAKANVYSNLIPVFTAIISFAFFGETFTWQKVIGIIMVIFGLILSQGQHKILLMKETR